MACPRMFRLHRREPRARVFPTSHFSIGHEGTMGYTGPRGMSGERHTCNRCGCVFAYGIDPHHWKTPWMSQTMKPEGSVRCYPCPDCGLYQPEMVMWLKVALQLSLLPALFALLILGAV